MNRKAGAGRLGISFLGAISLGVLAWGDPAASGGSAAQSAPSKFVGAQKCKLCHQKEKSGNQFGAWEKMKHAKAFETLGSEEAKKIGKEKGIEDPQKSDQCLKCHVTAFGVPAEQLDKNFDPKRGVQCESCHGPGEKHQKARLAAAAKGKKDEEGVQTIPADEIVAVPKSDVCLGCHNAQSPSFAGFCFKKYSGEVHHFDPRKKRTPEELEAMKCPCEECKSGTCKKPNCGE